MPTLDEFSLQKLIAGGETTTVVLRTGLPNLGEAAQNLCALSNTRGGYFIFEMKGPKEEGELFAVIEVILQAARQCFPTVLLEPAEPEVYNLGENSLVVATIPAMRWRKNGELHQTGGVFWTRRGSNTVPLRLNEIAESLRDQGNFSWELQAAPARATMDDLDMELVKYYVESRTSQSLRRRSVDRLNNLEKILVGLDCAVEVAESNSIRPTNAGLLMFSYEPQQFLRHTDIMAVVFRDEEGLEGYRDRKTFRGPLIDLIKQVEDFLKHHMERGGRVEGFERKDTWEYPLEALREAVVNAVVHRDYSREGESIRIFYYPSRVEIHSPGLLLPGLTVEKMARGETISKLRNPVIVNLLKDMPPGYIERMGAGIPMMIRQMRNLGLPDPDFTETDEFVVTFHHANFAITTPPVAKNPGPNNQVVDPKEKRLAIALQLARQLGYVTNLQYRQAAGISENTATSDLETLVQNGLLRVEGNTRRRRYLLEK